MVDSQLGIIGPIMSMTIYPSLVLLNNQHFFTGNFPDISVFDADGNVNFQLDIDNATVLKETYVQDANGAVRINNLGELIKYYFSLPSLNDTESDIISIEPLTINITLSDGKKTINFQCFVHYGDCNITIKPLSNILFSRYKKVYTNTNRKEFLSFNCGAERLETTVGYKLNNKIQYVGGGYDFDEDKIQSLNIMKEVSGLMPENAIPISCDVSLRTNEGGDYIEYIFEDCINKNEVNFIYINPFGLPETISFTGIQEYSPEMTGDIVEVLQEQKRVDPSFIDSRTINSGFLNKEKYNAVLDMIASPSIATYDGLSITDIIITDIDLQHKEKINEPFSVTITYRPANKQHNTFKRI